MTLPHSEQRARDALEFDPLPIASWLWIGTDAIYLTVRYSESLSSLIRALPMAQWDASNKRWFTPFSSAGAIRAKFDQIDALATQAVADRAEQERAWKAERDDRERARAAEYARREQKRLETRPRAIRPEYMDVAPAPKHALIIEAIADDAAGFGAFDMPPRNWVGQIVGLAANGKWARAYLNGARNYASANSKGSRGVMVTYLLDTGPVYEISAPRSWSSRDHYFCRIQAGEIVRMTESEVRACLAK